MGPHHTRSDSSRDIERSLGSAECYAHSALRCQMSLSLCAGSHAAHPVNLLKNLRHLQFTCTRRAGLLSSSPRFVRAKKQGLDVRIGHTFLPITLPSRFSPNLFNCLNCLKYHYHIIEQRAHRNKCRGWKEKIPQGNKRKNSLHFFVKIGQFPLMATRKMDTITLRIR